MDWLIVCELLIFLTIISMISLYLYLRKDMDNFDRSMYKSLAIALSLVFIGLALILPWCVYCEAITLSANYNCACDTVEETQELLMRFENLMDHLVT